MDRDQTNSSRYGGHMHHAQPGILAAVPRLARYLTFTLQSGGDVRAALQALRAVADGERCVVGLGESLLRALGRPVDGLHAFPSYAAAGIEVPATPAALWCWLRGDDRGALLHQGRAIESALAPVLILSQAVDGFQYRASRDLTGYEDGTENPQGDQAHAAALVHGRGPGRDGSAYVAVQQWVHDLDRFEALPAAMQDHIIGRRKSNNEEIGDAPPDAHVKRTAQESFQPAAFVLRRSMPWAEAGRAGLMFVAFGHSVSAFEVLLRRMVGEEDGIADALFRFTRPVSGAYYWCPPLGRDGLDLTLLGM
jgi:putative iron-dependent peroxidase